MTKFKDDFPKTHQWLNEDDLLPLKLFAGSVAGVISLVALMAYFDHLFNKYKIKGYEKCGIVRMGDGSRPMTLQQRKCVAIYEIKARKEMITKIKEKMNICNKTKNPTKCKSKLNDKITKHNIKIKEIEQDIKNYNK